MSNYVETGLSSASLRLKGTKWHGGDWSNHPSLVVGYSGNMVNLSIWANHPSKDANAYLRLTPVSFNLMLTMLQRVASDPEHTGFRTMYRYRTMSNGIMNVVDNCMVAISYNTEKYVELKLQFNNAETFNFVFTPDELAQPCDSTGTPLSGTIVSGMLASSWATLLAKALAGAVINHHQNERELSAIRKAKREARLQASAQTTAVSNLNNGNFNGFDSTAGMTT